MSTFFRRPLARVSLVTLVVLAMFGTALIGVVAPHEPENDDSPQVAGIEREGDIPLPVA